MANINCSFSKFNDLLGIQQVISLSILEGNNLLQVVQDVKDTYLKTYYGESLSVLGETNADISEALVEVGEAIKLALDEIANDNELVEENGVTLNKHVALGLFNGDKDTYFSDFEEIVDNVVGLWIADLAPDIDDTAVYIESQIKENPSQLTGQAVDLKFAIGGGNINTKVYPITSEKLNLNQIVDKENDFIRHYFKGVNTAYTKFVQNFKSNMIRKSLITLDPISGLNKKVITSNTDLDQSIKNWKNDLFKRLFPDKGDLYIGEGDNKISRPDYRELMNSVKEEYLQRGLDVKDLLMWTDSNSAELNTYFTYLTLANFDKMTSLYMNGILKIKKNLIGIDTESFNTPKYLLQGTSSLHKNWSDNDLINAFTEHSAMYKLLVENTNMISLNGEVTNRFLKSNTVAYAMSKLMPMVEADELVPSMRKALEQVIRFRHLGRANITRYNNAFSDAKTGVFTEEDHKVYITLYTQFFKPSIQESKSFLNDLGVVGKNILGNNISSYYEIFKDFNRDHNFDINIFEIVPATISKTVALNYNVVDYNFNDKMYKMSELNTKMSDKQLYIFRSLLNAKANLVTKSVLDNFKQTYNITIDKGNVTFNTGDRTFTIDVLNDKVTDSTGKAFNFKHINSPKEYFELKDVVTEELNPKFKEYSDLIDIVAHILDQPLKHRDYSLLFEFKGHVDTRGRENLHLDQLLRIAANVLYIQNIIAETGVNTNDKASLERVLNNSNIVGNLITDFRPMESVVDRRNGLIKVDFPKSAGGNTASSYNAIRSFADILSMTRGEDVKAIVLNAAGAALPTYGIKNLINDINNLKSFIKNQPGFTKSPLSKNIFVNNNLHLKNVIRTDVSMNDRLKSSAKLSPLETLKLDIIYDYLQAKTEEDADARNPIFQPTVFADKSRHVGIQMDGSAIIKLGSSVFSNKQYRDYNAADFRKLYYESQLDYYTKLGENLIATYNNVFTGTITPINQAYIDLNTKVLKAVLNDPDFTGQIDLSQPLSIEMLNFSKKQGKKKVSSLELYDGINLRNEIDNYNKLLKVSQSGIKNLAEADSILGLLNEKAFLQAARGNLNINSIVKELVYTKTGKKNTIGVNRTLVDHIERYNDIDTMNKVMDREKVKFLQNLIELDFTFDLVDAKNKVNPIIERAFNSFNIDKTSKWFNAKEGRFLLYQGEFDPVTRVPKSDFELNPILEQYFWESNAVNENFQNMTVGTIHGHPAKGDTSTIESEEAARLNAMFKRMVAHQATFHPYVLNTIEGVPFYNRVAYVKDPGKVLFNQMGETQNQDVTDGSTYTLLLHRVLENNSLLDQKAAIHHKSIGMTINRNYNAAGLMKHAAHGITNERIRNSESAENSLKQIIKKMMSEPFTFDGIEVNYDLTKDYKGLSLSLDIISKGRGVYYLDKDRNLIKVTSYSLIDLKQSLYNVTEYNQSTGAFTTKEVTVRSLYDIWNKILGGGTDTTDGYPERSVHQSEADIDSDLAVNQPGYVYGNDSWENLAAFVNNIGFRLNDKGLADLTAQLGPEYTTQRIKQVVQSRITKPLKDDIKDNDYIDQTTIYQPLKSHYIAQITFDSGQKVGVQNINETSILNRSNQDKFWISDFVSNLHTGIQLDYEHETDDSEVSEMTQIISALSFNGDAPEYAERVYKAIANYIDVNMSTLLPFINANNVEGKATFYNYIAKELVKSLETNDVVSLADSIGYKVREELNKQKNILNELSLAEPNTEAHKIALNELQRFEDENFKVPFSDSNIYNSFFTTVANLFTKRGIRRKLSGIAAIISPHSTFLELRTVPEFDNEGNIKSRRAVNDEGYNVWKSNLKQQDWFNQRVTENEGNLELTITQLLNEEALAEDVSLFDTVTYNGKTTRLDTYAKYTNFKNSVDPNEPVIINKGATRDLLPAQVSWKLGNKQKNYSVYDLPNVQLAFLVNDVQSVIKRVKGLKSNSTKGLSQYEIGLLQSDIQDAVTTYNNVVDEFNKIIDFSDFNIDRIVGTVDIVQNLDSIDVIAEIETPEFDDNMFKYIKNKIRVDYQNLNNNKKVPLTIEQIQNILNNPEKLVNDYGDEAVNLVTSYNEYKSQVGLSDQEALVEWSRIAKSLGELTFTVNGDLDIQPAEVALPKINKSKFNLYQDDLVEDITREKILSRLNAKSNPAPGMEGKYDFYLRSKNGEHIYVYLENSDNYVQFNSLFNDLKIETRVLRAINEGEEPRVFRTDEDGELMYEIGKTKFKKFVNGNTHEAVIIKGLDDLIALRGMINSKDSELIDLVTNYDAGVDVAKLGLTYNKSVSKGRKAEFFDRTLQTLNNLTNLKTKEERMLAITSNPNLLNEGSSLVEIYDTEWAQKEIDYLSKKTDLSKFDESKLATLQQYIVDLQSMMESPEAAQAAYDTALKLHSRQLNVMGKKMISRDMADPLENMLSRLNESQYVLNIASKNERMATEMYSSFRHSLNNTVARIPGQGMQSFMPTKTAFFLDTEANTAIVNPYNLWLTGGDFDIDKIFAVGYSFDKNGKLISWHPEFNYNSYELLKKSLELPISDGIERVVVNNSKGASAITLEDVNNVLNYYKGNNKDLYFPAFVDTINKISNSKYLHIVDFTEADAAVAEEFLGYINGDGKDILGYFNEISNTKHPVEATLNVIASNMYRAIIDPRNSIHAFAPIDMNDPAAAAAISTKGEKTKIISSKNPATIPIFKEGNMVGKEVIGIAATGLKVFSALSTRYMRAANGDYKNLPFFLRVKEFVLNNGNTETIPDDKIISIIGGINWDGKEDVLTSYLDAAIGVNLDEESKNIYIRKILADQEYKGDVALVLSALLSAATDNAKELILGKINAGPETAGMYIHAIIMGQDFKTFSNMMISRETQLIIDMSKVDIFNTNTSKRNLKNALSAIRNKMPDPYHYLDKDAINILANELLKRVKKGDIKVAKFDPDAKMSARTVITSILPTLTNNDLEELYDTIKDQAKTPSGLFMEGRVVKFGAYDEDGYDDGNYDEDGYEDDYNSGDHDDHQVNFYEDDSYYDEEGGGGANFIPYVNVRIPFNRFITDALNLRSKIGIGFNMDVVNSFEKSMLAADALTVLGSQLGANQGIKSNDFALYKYFNKLDNHVNELMRDFARGAGAETPTDLALDPEIARDGFNTRKFISDSDYRQRAIRLYESVKRDINILEVLSGVDHFKRMHELTGAAKETVERGSIKNRLIDHMIEVLSERDILPTNVGFYKDGKLAVRYKGTLKEEDYRKLSNFADEVIIANYLGSSGIRIKINEGDITVLPESYQMVQSSSDYNIKLDDNLGRTQFTTWFENTVIPDLKAGKLRDASGNYIQGENTELINNYFLTQFNIDLGQDPLTKATYRYLKLPVNMTKILSEDDKSIFDNLDVAFYNLKKFNYGGYYIYDPENKTTNYKPLNVLDLLYLYNLIVHKNRVTGSSLNKLFNTPANFDEDSFINDHLTFVGNLDRNVDLLKLDEHFSVRDALEKGLAREIDRLPSATEVAVRPQIVKIRSGKIGGQEFDYYVYENSIYKPVTLDINVLDKNIRIRNGSKNLRTILNDGRLLSAKARIKNLFGVDEVEIEKLDDTCTQ